MTQRIGLADVSITYSRPSAKGRPVFGDLVPYGEVWRTGANKATSLSTTGTLMLNGQKLAEGKYSVFTIPGEGAWQVIFNKNTELWGAYDRKPEEDVLTVKVPAQPVAFTETFTIEFANLGQDKADIVFRWEKQEAVLSVLADATEKAMANIKEALAKPDADFRAYARAASFCLDRRIGAEAGIGLGHQEREHGEEILEHVHPRQGASGGRDVQGGLGDRQGGRRPGDRRKGCRCTEELSGQSG